MGFLSNLQKKIKSVAHQATHPMETLKNVSANVKKDVKDAKKSVKTQLHDASVNISNTGQAAIKSIGDAAGKVGQAIEFLPLRLFEPVMRKALDRKGIHTTTKDGIQKISGLFFKHCISGSHLEHVDEDVSQTAEELATDDSGTKKIEPGKIKKLITKIIDFIKGIGKKKDKTPEEVAIAADVAPIHDTLAATVGGEDSQGNIHVLNDDGHVSAIVTKKGDVIETGKPHAKKITGHHLFGWF